MACLQENKNMFSLTLAANLRWSYLFVENDVLELVCVTGNEITSFFFAIKTLFKRLFRTMPLAPVFQLLTRCISIPKSCEKKSVCGTLKEHKLSSVRERGGGGYECAWASCLCHTCWSVRCSLRFARGVTYSGARTLRSTLAQSHLPQWVTQKPNTPSQCGLMSCIPFSLWLSWIQAAMRIRTLPQTTTEFMFTAEELTHSVSFPAHRVILKSNATEITSTGVNFPHARGHVSEKMRARFPTLHSAPHLTAALRRSWRIEDRGGGMHTSADPEPYGRAPKLCLAVMNIHIFCSCAQECSQVICSECNSGWLHVGWNGGLWINCIRKMTLLYSSQQVSPFFDLM